MTFYLPYHPHNTSDMFTGPLLLISRYTYILELLPTYKTSSISYPLYHVTTTSFQLHRVVQPLPNFSHPTTYHPLSGILTLLLTIPTQLTIFTSRVWYPTPLHIIHFAMPGVAQSRFAFRLPHFYISTLALICLFLSFRNELYHVLLRNL